MAYWLIKSEPSAYSWDQLVKDKKTSWTGVRNFQAQINLKAMKAGDRAFFYHSGEGKEIVGIAEVTKTAYPELDRQGRQVGHGRLQGRRAGEEEGDAGRDQGRPEVQGDEAGAPVAALGVAGQRRALEAPAEDGQRQVGGRQHPRHPRDVGGGRGLHLQRCADQACRREHAGGPGDRRARRVRDAVVHAGLLVTGAWRQTALGGPSARRVPRRARGGLGRSST